LVVSTFHALSLQICREHANLAGYGKDFVVRSTDYGKN
jgi:superfamily I DNA/RNA helicase